MIKLYSIIKKHAFTTPFLYKKRKINSHSQFNRIFVHMYTSVGTQAVHVSRLYLSRDCHCHVSNWHAFAYVVVILTYFLSLAFGLFIFQTETIISWSKEHNFGLKCTFLNIMKFQELGKVQRNLEFPEAYLKGTDFRFIYPLPNFQKGI